jgi:hypothetical protein
MNGSAAPGYFHDFATDDMRPAGLIMSHTAIPSKEHTMRLISLLLPILMLSLGSKARAREYISFQEDSWATFPSLQVGGVLIEGMDKFEPCDVSFYAHQGIGVSKGNPWVEECEILKLTFSPVPALHSITVHVTSLQSIPAHFVGTVIDTAGNQIATISQILGMGLSSVTFALNGRPAKTLMLALYNSSSPSMRFVLAGISYEMSKFAPGDTLHFTTDGASPSDETRAFFFGVAGMTLELALSGQSKGAVGIAELRDATDALIATTTFTKYGKRSLRVPIDGWYALRYVNADGVTQDLQLKTKAVLKKSDAKRTITLRTLAGGEDDHSVVFGVLAGMAVEVQAIHHVPLASQPTYAVLAPDGTQVVLPSATNVKKGGLKWTTPPFLMGGAATLDLDGLPTPCLLDVTITRKLTPIQGSDVVVGD